MAASGEEMVIGAVRDGEAAAGAVAGVIGGDGEEAGVGAAVGAGV